MSVTMFSIHNNEHLATLCWKWTTVTSRSGLTLKNTPIVLCSFISLQGILPPLLHASLLSFHRGWGFPSAAPWSTSSSRTQRQAWGLYWFLSLEIFTREPFSFPAVQTVDMRRSVLKPDNEHTNSQNLMNTKKELKKRLHKPSTEASSRWTLFCRCLI